MPESWTTTPLAALRALWLACALIAAAPAAAATPAAGSFTVRSGSKSLADTAAFAVFSSSDSAPARMSAGDLGAAPDDGEIEISSSIWKSSEDSAFADAAASASRVVATCPAPRAGGAPPSANIGLFGSSWRPSVTAFCHTSPCPPVTA